MNSCDVCPDYTKGGMNDISSAIDWMYFTQEAQLKLKYGMFLLTTRYFVIYKSNSFLWNDQTVIRRVVSSLEMWYIKWQFLVQQKSSKFLFVSKLWSCIVFQYIQSLLCQWILTQIMVLWVFENVKWNQNISFFELLLSIQYAKIPQTRLYTHWTLAWVAAVF